MSQTIYYPLEVAATFIVHADGSARFYEYDWATHARGALDPENLPDWVREFFCEDEPIPVENLRDDKDWKFYEIKALPYDPDDIYGYDVELNNDRIRIVKTWTAKDGPKVGYDGNPFPSPAAEISSEQKWSCWDADEREWEEDWGKLRQLQDGQTLRICVSSRKECRGGQVDVTRIENNRWQVEGHFTAYWDELDALADTLGQVLVDHDDWEEYFHDWDVKEQPIAQMKRYLKDKYGYSEGDALEREARRLQVNNHEAFAECIPMSYHAMDPGVDHDFTFEFEGTVEELMARIDKEEDALVDEDAREWGLVKGLFNREDLT